MIQITRNQPADNQGMSGRGSEENQERKKYDGFEGMNYEQRRQPYSPGQSDERNREESDNAGNGRGMYEV